MVEIKNGKAILKRGKKEVVLTDNEISAVHKLFVMQWMQLTAETDFNIPEEDSWEVAEKGYDLYSDGDGLSEYEAIQKVAENYNKRWKTADNIKVGDHIVYVDELDKEHELLIQLIDENMSHEKTFYVADLTYEDDEMQKVSSVSEEDISRILQNPKPAFFFTFGSDEKYPYRHGYIIIRADDIGEAILKFQEKYPDREPGISTINCAFYYNEAEWIQVGERHHERCHEIIK